MSTSTYTRFARFGATRTFVALAGAVLLAGGAAWAIRSHHADDRGELCASTWVLHYTRADAPVNVEVYRRMLKAMPPGVRACVVAQDSDAVRARAALRDAGADVSAIDLVTVSEPLSGWARDRYTFFERDGMPHVLVPPRRHVHADAHGDLLVPLALQALHPDLTIVEVDFHIEGGDVLVLPDRVLLGANSVLLNVHTLGPGADEFLARVEAVFGRPVLVVGRTSGGAPYPHIDMILTAIDEETILLGDPTLGLEAFERGGRAVARLDLGGGGVFHRQRQQALVARYDAIRVQLESAGYRVHRLPIAHGEPTSRNTWGCVLSWTNVVLETVGGRRLAFVPHYGVAPLDERAVDIWEAWGFAVVPIPVRPAFEMGGTLRCLTNVLPGHAGAREHGLHERRPL